MTPADPLAARLAEIEARAKEHGCSVARVDVPFLTTALRRAVDALVKIEETQPNNEPVIWAIVTAAHEALADIARAAEGRDD